MAFREAHQQTCYSSQLDDEIWIRFKIKVATCSRCHCGVGAQNGGSSL